MENENNSKSKSKNKNKDKTKIKSKNKGKIMQNKMLILIMKTGVEVRKTVRFMRLPKSQPSACPRFEAR